MFNIKSKRYSWYIIAYHDERSIINKFIVQHQLKNYKIDVVKNNDDIDQQAILEEHYFKSNYNDDEYTVWTNDRILKQASDYVADKLSNVCVFGNIIVENKIPIVDIVNKLLDDLPYVEIIDYSLMDEINDASLEHIKSGNYEAYDGRTPDNESYETQPGDWIFDTLRDDVGPMGCVEPITLEAYVEFIASLTTDEPEDE